jgi:hypothetical protein
MKKSLWAGISLLAAAPFASAAEIHGTVSDGGKPVPSGIALRLECATASADGKTDDFGSYSLKLAGTGECRLSVTYQGATAALTVTVYEKPSRYDVAVRKDGGKLVLSRK